LKELEMLSQGSRVRLKTFLGSTSAPTGTEASDNYWLLLGEVGTVVNVDDKGAIGVHRSGRRVLVQLEQDMQKLGLSCHNAVSNALWFFVSDLESV
jgi:hypothetical protein